MFLCLAFFFASRRTLRDNDLLHSARATRIFDTSVYLLVCLLSLGYYVWFVALRGRNCDMSVYFFLFAVPCFYGSDARARLVHGIPAFLLCCTRSLRARCAPG